MSSKVRRGREWLAWGALFFVATVVAALAANVAEARPASQIQAEIAYCQGQIQAYEQAKVKAGCSSGRNSQACALYTQQITYFKAKLAELQRELAQSGGSGNSGGAGGVDKCEQTRRDIAQRSTNGRQKALAYVKANPRPRNGYYLRVIRPPSHCGGSWTYDTRTYYYSRNDATRAIDQHANNGHEIDFVLTW